MSDINISCPKCGASIDGKSLYCNYCGTAITDVRDLLLKQAKIDLQQKENDEKLRLETQKHKMAQRQMILKLVFLALGIGVVLFMCIMASR